MTALLAELPVPRCVLFVLLALLASPPGWAAESVERLYETVVRIADRTEATRQQAVRDGFAQVLVRLTGYSRVAQLAGVAGELARAQTYLLESSVERAPVVAADRLGTEQGDLLWVRFNRALVDALVERLELPVWPALRPSLAYVAVSDHWGVPAIPTAAEHPALWLRLQSLFAGRGLVAGALDVAQLGGLAAADLWNLDARGVRRLRRVRERAGVDILALVRAERLAGGARVDFLFLAADGATVRGSGLYPDLLAGLAAGVNSYIDDLALGLSFVGGATAQRALRVRVEGVRTRAQYRRILRLVAGLEQVSAAHLHSIDDRGMTLAVRYQSDVRLLQDAIVELAGLEQAAPAAAEQFAVDLGGRPRMLRFYDPSSAFLTREQFKAGPQGAGRIAFEDLPQESGTEAGPRQGRLEPPP